MNCLHCGKPISEERLKKHAVYCSTVCRKANELKKWKERNPNPEKLGTTTIGELSALLITVDLMKKGYNVFAALAPCSCTLIAMKEDILLRIRTRTGVANLNGTVYFTPPDKKDGFDVLAVITNGNIVYEPEITSFSSETN